MILKHETIDLNGSPLFTSLTMETPSQVSVPIPSDACFAYIIDGDNQMLVEQMDLRAEPGKVILSLCGYTLGNIIAEQEPGQVTSIIVHFSREHLRTAYENSKPPLWREIERPVTQILVQDAASELVKRYFEGVGHLFQNREAVSEGILIVKLQEIILLLMQTNNSPEIAQIMNSLFSERTFSFKELIDAHLYSNASIQDLAMLTNLSLSSFKREFRKIYDDTPGSYILNKRTEKVAEQLEFSDESVSTIGYQCGFNSPAHLSRVFKSKYGVTPSEYRLNLSVK